MGPLPSCALGDVYTVPRGYDDWSTTLVDRLLRVEATYVPPDLMRVSEMGIAGGGSIRGVAAADTRAMAKAARAAGAPIGVWSGYRNYEQQTQLFNGYVTQNGFDSAITYSQRPGHSEHQLGLGVDFMSAGGGNPLPGDWGKTPAGSWMRENAWKYGWVNSYPRGAGGSRWNDRSCFRYEPWHYRYLGREMAAKVHASGLTIREYLWNNDTMLDRNGTLIAPATSMPSASASTSASPSASPSPTTPLSGTPSDPSVAATAAGPAVDPAKPAASGSGLGAPALVAAAAVLLGAGAALAVAARRRRSRRQVE
ncbi:peptidase [Intrasporangium oryzae NRRL B-24470]|uniref:Peptidase n=2 Tax=Intrasporangium TaxID=53357 RepID=W9G5H2_9MICO|nr:peptidase [Intrasporangium oryzae NRRL B-24470]